MKTIDIYKNGNSHSSKLKSYLVFLSQDTLEIRLVSRLSQVYTRISERGGAGAGACDTLNLLPIIYIQPPWRLIPCAATPIRSESLLARTRIRWDPSPLSFQKHTQMGKFPKIFSAPPPKDSWTFAVTFSSIVNNCRQSPSQGEPEKLAGKSIQIIAKQDLIGAKMFE